MDDCRWQVNNLFADYFSGDASTTSSEECFLWLFQNGVVPFMLQIAEWWMGLTYILDSITTQEDAMGKFGTTPPLYNKLQLL